MKQPFEESYWMVPGKLAAGEYPGALSSTEATFKMNALFDAGVNHFIDLTHKGELNPYFHLTSGGQTPGLGGILSSAFDCGREHSGTRG